MQVIANLSDKTVKNLLTIQEVERGKIGNYTRVEDIVNPCRYAVADIVMSLVMEDINYQLGIKPVLHNY